MEKTETPYDVIIVGAGISGIIILRHAVKAGLKVLVLERASQIGGLWRDLPDWQDIQQLPQDWTLNGLPIHGPMRRDVLENIQAWLEKYRLREFVRLGQAVTKTIPDEAGWTVRTQDREYRARYLILATGAHNRPVLPKIVREDVGVVEYHSSNFPAPEKLRDQSVTVVGSGASALDLLELCFVHQAREVHWVYRSTRWFFPSRHPKYEVANLRGIARLQSSGKSVAEINAIFQQALDKRYVRFGIEAIRPDFDFDFNTQQMIPGRAGMIQNFPRIIRHPHELVAIRGNRIETADDGFSTDYVLYATGYEVDLGYTQLSIPPAARRWPPRPWPSRSWRISAAVFAFPRKCSRTRSCTGTTSRGWRISTGEIIGRSFGG